MPSIIYPAGTGITTVSNVELEASDATFVCMSIAGSPQQTDYSDIKDGIVGNPEALGGVTPATSLSVVGTTSLNGAVVVNEAGANVDMRVEGETDPYLFLVDADADSVGIGTVAPSNKLEVLGSTGLNGALIVNNNGADVDARFESINNTHMLFVDASADAIGVNNSAPASDIELDITGRLRSSDAVFYDEFWNGKASEWATRTTTGSVAAQSLDNGWLRLTTGGVATNEESLDWNDVCTFANTKRPTFECRIQLSSVADIEVDVGLMEASGGADDDFILIRLDSYLQNTWYLEASTAGTSTTEMGAVADTNAVELRFIFTSDTALEWFVNGVSQGVITTNVPTVQLQPVIAVRTTTNAAKDMIIDYDKIWQDRT